MMQHITPTSTNGLAPVNDFARRSCSGRPPRIEARNAITAEGLDGFQLVMSSLRNRFIGSSLVALMILTHAAGCPGQARDRFSEIRRRMVAEVIEAEGITNPLVLDAIRNVRRHEFVSGTLRGRAYQDTALPIGSQQTISPPYIVAYMTDTIDPQPEDRVLEVGTGSGYQAAVLAEIVKEVYSVEIVSALAKSATRRLSKLGYDNIKVRDGDGYEGWAEHAPFDKVIVTCSPESVPQPLIDQLRDGGMMIIPKGQRYQQSFYLLRKEGGELKEQKLVPTLFVPMTGASEQQRRVQPDPRHPSIVNGDFEIDGNEDGRVDGWHYQRQAEMCSEKPMRGPVCLRFSNQDPGQLSQALQGCAVSGRNVAALDLAVWARVDSVVPGPRTTDFAAVVIHFYDSVRRELGVQIVGKWRGTANWQQSRRRIPVPTNAREIVIRIGLNGATGTLDLDDFRMAPVLRR
ncbi:MAG: protein-L-isoaspartate(D-aspartate) O-methyltransferase [Fuerstiella sp.]|nr:protein-L-isoaspartate(D-aspartate) O-methyltransferase [Fuerstiella sp.]MCP4513575.1 protein-L-isoaspartate(D-aspartate) O-methyltransferase [Fuerstiella sp.]